MIDEIHYCLFAAFVLDLILGDPRWLPHPVRGVGWVIHALDRILSRSYAAGVLLALLVCAGTFWAAWGVVAACESLADHRAALVAQTLLMYFAFATRDLDVESRRVYRDLDDLERARRSLSMIVGRDTAQLDEREIVRATVETVAENTVDGVVTPILFAAAGGAPAAWLFKAISTLDSMVGHKTPRYARLGWASARLDSVANFLPARLTGALMSIAAAFCGLRAWDCARVMLRDGRKSPSLNAGIPEAAVAGALGVRLGGWNSYEGQPLYRPELGDGERGLDRRDILRAIAMMYVTAFLALGAAFAFRYGLLWATCAWF